MIRTLLLAGAFALAPSVQAALDPSNPFAAPSQLPFQYPLFDRIQNEHYLPAYEEGMREQAAEIEAIANNRAAPTFDNTIVALERSGSLLRRVSSVFGNLSGANTNPELQKLDRELAPRTAAHSDAIYLNARLFKRVQALYAKRASLKLDAESRFLLERYHKDFVRAGARLSSGGKARLKAINAELAGLQTRFSQNVLHESNASALLVDTPEELDGMSEAAIAAAASAAEKAGHKGKYLLALVNTSTQPLLAVLKNREVRRRLLDASLQRGSRGGEYDNREVVRKIVSLRAQRAGLLGYPNHAAYVLDDQTAKTTAAVNQLLRELSRPASANARKEAGEIQARINQEMAASSQSPFELGAHDWSHYAEKVRTTRFNFDESQLKPYFELNSVLLNGVFHAATQVYGITFKERHDLPVYDPDVRVFDVIDHDGKPLAIFLADFYARPNKRGGAWANAYVAQSHLLGQKPVIANHLNVPKPPAGEATLLTYDEVRTLFHEFGHALHAMFSNVKYPRFAGTRVPRDFVEFPSQVNEMWMAWPSVLSNYARHYQSGAAMPRELLDKVIAAQQFNEGYRTTEYLAASILDQRWHQLGAKAVPDDVPGFEAQVLKEAGVDLPMVPPRYRSTYFLHPFHYAYSASYYGYLWSEKLDADTVEWFNENGGLTRANGERFRTRLLSRGGTMDAMTMYRQFRGRDARIEPLLLRRGLTGK